MNSERSSQQWSYRDAGVDIDAGDAVVSGIRAAVARTRNARVIGGLGHFGGFYRIGPAGPGTTLVASADGVGTKLMVAIAAGRHDGVGFDIVHHCVNDILAGGAQPLFFLDYFGTGKLNPVVATEVVISIARACEQLGIALLGGETAEMPGLYRGGDYDLVGFVVGVVDEDRIIDGAAIRPDDVLLGLPSNGFHTNGYSLVRAALRLNEMDGELARTTLTSPAPFGPERTLADALLAPHRCYRDDVTALTRAGIVQGMAHITGGGLPGNVGRVIAPGMIADIDARAWAVPPLFRHVVDAGNIPPVESYRAFNMGIGFVVAVRPGDVALAQELVPDALEIGQVRAGSGEARVALHGLDAGG